MMIRTSSSSVGWCEVSPAELGDEFKHFESLPGNSFLERPDLNSALFLQCVMLSCNKS